VSERSRTTDGGTTAGVGTWERKPKTEETKNTVEVKTSRYLGQRLLVHELPRAPVTVGFVFVVKRRNQHGKG